MCQDQHLGGGGGGGGGSGRTASDYGSYGRGGFDVLVIWVTDPASAKLKKKLEVFSLIRFLV